MVVPCHGGVLFVRMAGQFAASNRVPWSCCDAMARRYAMIELTWGWLATIRGETPAPIRTIAVQTHGGSIHNRREPMTGYGCCCKWSVSWPVLRPQVYCVGVGPAWRPTAVEAVRCGFECRC